MTPPTIRRNGLLAQTAGLAFALLIFASPRSGFAQDVKLPRVGQQYGSVGVMVQPGFLYDPTFPTGRTASGNSWNRLTPAAGGVLQLGFHQIVTRRFMMAAEAQIGLQWLDEHTANAQGQADSESVLAWQLGLLGRWLPFGERAGWHVGLGPSFYRAYLEGSALQMLGIDLRAGKFLWQAERSFVLLEVGYVIPALQGLDKPTKFSTGRRNDVVSDWTFHRFGLSIQYGF